MNQVVSARTWAKGSLSESKPALTIGLGLALLAGAPMPLPQIAMAGPILAGLAYGAAGARAAAALGFVSYLVLNRPEVGPALVAAALTILVGWAVPKFLADAAPEIEEEERRSTSAIAVDCQGFASLDEVYGAGTSEHVFRMLRRALETETREHDLVVQTEGDELVVVLDGASAEIAQAVMARVERRFGAWLSDAGYECNLSVGLSDLAGADETDDYLGAAPRPFDGPYLD